MNSRFTHNSKDRLNVLKLLASARSLILELFCISTCLFVISLRVFCIWRSLFCISMCTFMNSHHVFLNSRFTHNSQDRLNVLKLLATSRSLIFDAILNFDMPIRDFVACILHLAELILHFDVLIHEFTPRIHEFTIYTQLTSSFKCT
jgi:hypothetical protein